MTLPVTAVCLHEYGCFRIVFQLFMFKQQGCRFDVYVGGCLDASGAMGELVQQLRGGGSFEGKPLQFAGAFFLLRVCMALRTAAFELCPAVHIGATRLPVELNLLSWSWWRNGGAACAAAEGRRQR
jgi:hypothetical protein